MQWSPWVGATARYRRSAWRCEWVARWSRWGRGGSSRISAWAAPVCIEHATPARRLTWLCEWRRTGQSGRRLRALRTGDARDRPFDDAADDVPSCLWVAARVVAVGAGARRVEPKHAHAEIGRERLLDRRATGIGHGPANDLANVASARRAPADLDVVSRRVLGSRQVQCAIARNVEGVVRVVIAGTRLLVGDDAVRVFLDQQGDGDLAGLEAGVGLHRLAVEANGRGCLLAVGIVELRAAV